MAVIKRAINNGQTVGGGSPFASRAGVAAGSGRGAPGALGRVGGRSMATPFAPAPAPRGGGGGGRGGGGGGGGGRSFRAPNITKVKTTATPPAELTQYMNEFKTEALGGLASRLGEVRDQGGAFMEEATRQSREEASARLEEARRRAEAAGIPFDERAAMRDIMKQEAATKANAQQAQENRVDDLTKSTVGAYTSGLGIVQSPSQAALSQKAQSLQEQQALMNYWLGQENAATSRFAAANQAQQGWMSLLSSMLNSGFA
jgi:hypothetical protein